MLQDDGHDIIIVSDLHLSAGYDVSTGTFNRNEDFVYDAAFARFVDNLCGRAAKENRRWRLLILGDLFDFPHVEIKSVDRYRRDTSEEIILRKLERIAEGHPEFFEALGRWVNMGFPLDIIPGNHDIELMRQSVQERFKDLIVRFSGRSEAAGFINFYSWIYYVPGVVYAEHGHQYHDINWFATLLRPYLSQDSDEIDEPPARYLDKYLTNLVESIDSSTGIVTPPLRYLTPAFRTHPMLLLNTFHHHVHFLKILLRHLSNLSSPQQVARREAYHEEVLTIYSTEIGLSYETLVAIDQLAATSAMSIKRRLLRKFILGPMLRALPSLGALLTMYVAFRKMRFTARSFLAFAASALILARRKRRSVHAATRSSAYLQHVPLIIHRTLQTENKNVPYYVFGHTHIAEQFPLVFNTASPYYLNTGTWTRITPLGFESLGNRQHFTFVQITRESESNAPIGQLLLWNDATGCHEPLPLLKA